MTITVKHKFVSAIPDEADATVVRPSNWNDDHQLTGTVPVVNGGTGASDASTARTNLGLGTIATQNANSVAVTGGTLNGVAIGGTTAGNGSFDVLSSNVGNLNGTIGSTTPNTGAFTYLSTNNTTSTTPSLSFNASNANMASGATVSGSYLQNLLQNKSGTAGASTNYVLSNDLGTDSTYYGEFGMNSSAYSSGTPADFFSINNGVYFSGHDGDITVGSGNGKKTYLAWGTSGQSAHVINATGSIGLNTNITGTTNFGTTGQVLTSQGSSSTPTWTTPTTGTVTSVGTTGTVNGLTLTGGPITGSGTVTLGGTLDLSSPPAIGSTTPSTGAFTTLKANSELVNQSYDQGTGVLQVTGQSSFNGAVVDKSLNLQGGNNLLLQSNTFTNGVWNTLGGATATANTTNAPDGTLTGYSLTESSTLANHIIYQNPSATGGNTYTSSIYLKANTRTFGGLQILSSSGTYRYCVVINLTTGAFGSSDSTGSPINTTYSITNAGNGWWRLAVTMQTPSASTVVYNQPVISNSATPTYSSSAPYYTGDGTSGIYISWAQVELGSVASAYTPTTTAAVTTTNNLSIPSGTVTSNSYSINSGTGFYGSSTGSEVGSAGSYSFSSTTASNGTPDTYLYRDAANTLAQRNSTNAQAFRLYNTYTSSSVGEWLSVDWTTTANTATIVTKANGAGVVRTLATGNPLVISTGYTVANLPTGVVGMRAYVTDAVLPTYLGALTGGGAVKCPVFYNGTAWVSA